MNETLALGSSPRGAVARETWRAAGSLLAAPLFAAAYLATRGRRAREAKNDLAHPAPVDPATSPERLPDRPLSIFVSCAEPSGEAHTVHLVHALRSELEAAGAPPPSLLGLGGERLAEAGVRIVGDPVARAAMGTDVLRSLSFYRGLLVDAAAALREVRPDVCLPVDSPALHVPLGHIARGYGVPVCHYVSPQYWGWAPWRVRSYRRAVDRTLTILPFEPAWFRRHGVPAAHVGHPQLDLLEPVQAPPPDDPARTNLVLLPGSRASVVERNLPWMLVAAARARLILPDLEVVLPHDLPGLGEAIDRELAAAGARDWVRVATGDLHAELGRARVALSVSGTILIDLLHHRIPTAVVYRVKNSLAAALSRHVLTVPWFSSVNLLADRPLLPEACFAGLGPVEEVAEFLVRAHAEEAFRAELQAGLEEAKRRLGPPGAARRAARHALALAVPSAP